MKLTVQNRYLSNAWKHFGVGPTCTEMYISNTLTANLKSGDVLLYHRYRSITKQFFRRVDGVVIIYDITVEESFEAVGPWIANIHEAVGNDIPIMVLGNKMDLENDRAVSLKQGKRLAQV